MDFEKKDQVDWKGHYISDPTVFRAVAFANQLLSEGNPMKDSFGIAANHYKIPISSVAVEFMTHTFMKKNSFKVEDD